MTAKITASVPTKYCSTTQTKYVVV